jgi:hypothetical protein
MIAKAAFHIGRIFGYEASLTRDGPLFEGRWIEWERHEGNYFHLWVFGYELVTTPLTKSAAAAD